MDFYGKMALIFVALLVLVFALTYFNKPGIPECDGITSFSERYRCYIAYPAPQRSTFDCTLLDLTSNGYGHSRDSCYFDEATYFVDEGLCEKIISQQTKNVCFNSVSRTDERVCEKIIGDDPLIRQCYEHVASWKEVTPS